MKKVIAGIIILTTVFCELTGCGNKEETNEKTSKAEKTTASVKEATNEKSEDEVLEATTVSDDSFEDTSFEEFVKEFVEAYINNERKKTFEMQEPNNFLDIRSVIQQVVKYEEYLYLDMTEEEFISEWQWRLYDEGKKDEKAVFKRIISTEKLSNDEMKDREIDLEYGLDKWLMEYVTEHGGVDNVNIDDFREAWEELDDDHLGDDIKFEKSYLVKFEVEYEKSGEIAQGEVIVYRIKGGEWKIYVPYSGNFIMSKSDEAASAIIGAENYALEEMDVSQKMEKAFIVSSAESKNYNIPDYFNRDNFIKKTKEAIESSIYDFKNIDEAEWFSVLYNWRVLFCVAYVKDQPKYFGIYPKEYIGWGKEIFADINDKISDDMTFDEMYDVCVNIIANR